MEQKKKGFSPLILIGLVVLVLGAIGGYLILTRGKGISQPVDTQNPGQEEENLADKDYIYYEVVETDKDTGLYCSQREYFKLNQSGEKVVVLKVPDFCYSIGWSKIADTEVRTTDLNQAGECQVGDATYPCFKDHPKTLNITFNIKYDKDSNNLLFSTEKEAVYIWDTWGANFVLSGTSRISQSEIDGLFEDDAQQLYLNNADEINRLKKSGNAVQKAWAIGLLKQIGPQTGTVEWTHIGHDNYWPDQNKYFFPNIRIYYPQKWYFQCCVDTDAGSFHFIRPKETAPDYYVELLTMSNNVCPDLGDGCAADETIAGDPEIKMRSVIKNIPSDAVQIPDVSLKNMDTEVFAYTKKTAIGSNTKYPENQPAKYYYIKLKEMVLRIGFINYGKFEPGFIDEFLNRLEMEI